MLRAARRRLTWVKNIVMDDPGHDEGDVMIYHGMDPQDPQDRLYKITPKPCKILRVKMLGHGYVVPDLTSNKLY